MRKNCIFKVIIVVILVVFASYGCEKEEKITVQEAESEAFPIDCTHLGVWWWNDALISQTDYLNFVKKQGVNEIYLCTAHWNEQTANFVTQCKNKHIAVFLLAGEYEWIEDPTSLYALIDNYLQYQNDYPQSQFAGIHLDIEPHQHPQFSAQRGRLLQQYCDLIVDLRSRYAISFDYDIPFWFHDTVEQAGERKELYKFVCDHAARVFVMSYRDTAAQMYAVAKDEYEYAETISKELFFSALTSPSEEGDGITFYEEGQSYMYQELNKLQSLTGKKCSIAIHHLQSWYEW